MYRRQLFVCNSVLLTYFTASLTLHGVRSTAPWILKAAALTSSNLTLMAGLGASLCKSAESADDEPNASVWFIDIFGRLSTEYQPNSVETKYNSSVGSYRRKTTDSKRGKCTKYLLIRIPDGKNWGHIETLEAKIQTKMSRAKHQNLPLISYCAAPKYSLGWNAKGVGGGGR